MIGILAVAAAIQEAGGAGPGFLPVGLWPEGLTWDALRALLVVGGMALLGIPLLFGFSRWTRNAVGRRYSPQQGLIAGKLIFYPGMALLLVTILSELGLSFTPLLGAAGIAGIAIGFASQTSISNVISGFFLIAERPFEVDDVVQVGDTVGRVLSIDTLSVKLRTFDNRFVRIPNETIVKSQVTTITRFPIRRLDVKVGVAYKEDVARVRKVILDVVRKNPRALMEPPPAVFFDGYGDSALDLRMAVWASRENFIELKNSLLEDIKVRFDAEGIEIPFPHRTLYVGMETDPFPVRWVPGLEPAPGGAATGAEPKSDPEEADTAGEPEGEAT